MLVNAGPGGTTRANAVSSSNLKLRWTQEADRRIDTPAVVSGGQAYFGSSRGKVFAPDMATGAVVWKANAGHPVLGPAEWSNNVRPGLIGWHRNALRTGR